MRVIRTRHSEFRIAGSLDDQALAAISRQAAKIGLGRDPAAVHERKDIDTVNMVGEYVYFYKDPVGLADVCRISDITQAWEE